MIVTYAPAGPRRVVWDVSSVVAGEDKDTTEAVDVARHVRPPETLADSPRGLHPE